jgi:hypothetical protein
VHKEEGQAAARGVQSTKAQEKVTGEAESRLHRKASSRPLPCLQTQVQGKEGLPGHHNTGPNPVPEEVEVPAAVNCHREQAALVQNENVPD